MNSQPSGLHLYTHTSFLLPLMLLGQLLQQLSDHGWAFAFGLPRRTKFSKVTTQP